MNKTFKAIIIGSGQGGTPLAKKLAEKGWSTALVERKHMGGTCINTGCTPTKAMIASAKTAYTVASASKLGVSAPEFKVDYPAVIARKNKIVEQFRTGSKEGAEKTENLEVIFGEATFSGEKTLSVVLNDGSAQSLTAEYIFIDTGTRPRIPQIEGLEEAGYFTSATLMEETNLPEHLLIIGGNYIGLEFGQMYRRFGSRVTILEHNDRLLQREDEDIAAEVVKFLREENIDIKVNAVTKRVEKKENGLHVTVSTGDKTENIHCSHILVAAGTTPNTEALNLPAAGVETDDKGFIKTDEFLQTTAAGIYAIGDVKGGPAFTHISYNDYLVLYKNIVEHQHISIKNRMVPYCMFTDPQLGRIGMSEEEAKKKGIKIKVAKLEMSNVARAIETGRTSGLMKAVVDEESGRILGASILGEEGGETATVIEMAMLGNIPYQVVKDMIIAHPLYAESLNNLFMSLDT